VLQAAAIPVPDALGEDEILIAVVPKAGASVTPHEVADWCRQHLAAIKVPRYVVIVDSLPLTPTLRVAKYQMRSDTSLRDRATDLASARSPG
jgi:crotonobetaine/carnitine-CoA ligase